MSKNLDTRWLAVIAGALIAAAGINVLLGPAGFLTLGMATGIAAILRGLLLVITSDRIRQVPQMRGSTLFSSVLGLMLIVFGIFVFFNPGLEAQTLAYFVAGWFLLDTVQIILATRWLFRQNLGVWIYHFIIYEMLFVLGLLILVLARPNLVSLIGIGFLVLSGASVIRGVWARRIEEKYQITGPFWQRPFMNM